MDIKKTISDLRKFESSVSKILSVSHEELKRREAKWKRQRERRRKAKKR